jgi:hypothetical protein
MKIEVDVLSMQAVKKVLSDLGENISKQMSIAVNKTTVQARTAAARKMKESIPVPVKVLKKTISKWPNATDKRPSSGLFLFGGYPFPLKYFKPKQRAGGVSYQPGNADKSHGYRPHSFLVKKYDGRVFMRKVRGKGSKRSPIEQQFGMSPASAIPAVAKAATEVAKNNLPKQINERIRFLTLKAKGQLKGKQK